MTVLVAVPCDEGVWVGSDGLATAGNSVLGTRYVKWRIGPPGLSVGVSGSAFVEHWLWREAAKHTDPHELCAAFRSWLRSEGWEPQREERMPPKWDLNLLLTDGERVWDVGSSLYPDAPRSDAIATGGGFAEAMGALHAGWGLKDYSPRAHCLVAIEAACVLTTGCGGEPFVALVKLP